MKTKKISSLFIALSLVFSFFLVHPLFIEAMAQDTAPAAETGKKDDKLATNPSECGSKETTDNGVKAIITPRNCLFLEEPIGGKANYDLYLVTCVDKEGRSECTTALWNGGSIPQGSTVKQALLTEDPNKPYQGPFGLLYSYVQLIYAYMSGLIVGVSVLFVVIGGMQMSMSNGDESKFTAGKSRITKAAVGIIIWFTASLILYTINPTFFAF